MTSRVSFLQLIRTRGQSILGAITMSTSCQKVVSISTRADVAQTQHEGEPRAARLCLNALCFLYAKHEPIELPVGDRERKRKTSSEGHRLPSSGKLLPRHPKSFSQFAISLVLVWNTETRKYGGREVQTSITKFDLLLQMFNLIYISENILTLYRCL